jgi:hypothetical protein
MLLQLDQIPSLHDVLASLFTRLLLAEYIVFSGTFTSLRTSNAFKIMTNRNETVQVILDTGSECAASLIGSNLLCNRIIRDSLAMVEIE